MDKKPRCSYCNDLGFIRRCEGIFECEHCPPFGSKPILRSPKKIVEDRKVRVYIASSWRNPIYDSMREYLTACDFEVYDFKNEETAFRWEDVDPDWDRIGDDIVNHVRFETLMSNPAVKKAYNADFEALRHSDIVILLLPAGRSAHLEAGWAVGHGKVVIVYVYGRMNPVEVMYAMLGKVFDDLEDLLAWLDAFRDRIKKRS